MASLILGVTGKKRSGKDTFASRLVTEHGFTRLAFADALKQTMIDLDPIVECGNGYGALESVRLTDVLGPDLDWELAKEMPEVRRLLQAHGVALRDHVDPNVWVNAVALKAEQIPGPVVVTDVRFPNEADWITQVGGTLVRVIRPSLVSTDEHISETALDSRPANVVVVNDRDVPYLYKQADTVTTLIGHS